MAGLCSQDSEITEIWRPRSRRIRLRVFASEKYFHIHALQLRTEYLPFKTMRSNQCAAVTAPDTLWSFCPNVGAAYAFAIFFGLTFIAHVAQGIYYRKAYTWVIAMSALWQLIAYIFRIVSINTPANLGNYAAWFVLILVAPLWTNAFVYMVLGRMVWNFTRQAKVYGITAWNFTAAFVVLDIMYVSLFFGIWHVLVLTRDSAFVVQVYGAAATQGKGITRSEVLNGKSSRMKYTWLS
jgi:hypothetical protein